MIEKVCLLGDALGGPAGTSTLRVPEDTGFSRVIELLQCARVDRGALSGLTGLGVIREFEEGFTRCVGAEFGVAVSSGTSALIAALAACGVGPGDDVMVSTYGWGGTVGAVLALGARPVFVDIEPVSLNLDAAVLEEAWTGATSAILATHFLGLPADVHGLRAVAQQHGVPLIFDAAQAIGASHSGVPTGAFGDVVAYSFGRGKAVCTGEGGMAVTRDERLYERLVLATQHPIRALREVTREDARRWIDEISLGSRMHPVAAAIGLEELASVEDRIRARRRYCESLASAIDGVPGLRVVTGAPESGPAYYHLGLTYSGLLGIDRSVACEAFRREGVAVTEGPVRVPLHLRPRFRTVSAGREAPPLRGLAVDVSAPVAEHRCEYEELVLESQDRWTVNIDEVESVAARLRRVAERLASNEPDAAARTSVAIGSCR